MKDDNKKNTEISTKRCSWGALNLLSSGGLFSDESIPGKAAATRLKS